MTVGVLRSQFVTSKTGSIHFNTSISWLAPGIQSFFEELLAESSAPGSHRSDPESTRHVYRVSLQVPQLSQQSLDLLPASLSLLRKPVRQTSSSVRHVWSSILSQP